MIPGDVCELAALRIKTWGRIEVVAARKHRRRTVTQRHRNQFITRLLAWHCVVFAHADKPSASRVHDRVRITPRTFWSDRLRLVAKLDAIDPLISIVAEPGSGASHRHSAATILVSACTYAVGRPQDVYRMCISRAANQHLASTFRWASLYPPNAPILGQHIAKANGVGDDDIRAER